MGFAGPPTDLDMRSVSGTVLSSEPESSSPQSQYSSAQTTMSTGSGVPLIQPGTQHAATPPPQAPQPSPEPERSVPENRKLAKLLGWPRLAEIMAKKPELASFARFRELNVKNLLYYQVELSQWEHELENIQQQDATSPNKRVAGYACLAVNMPVDHENTNPEAVDDDTREKRRQWDMVLKIRTLLKEYNDALLQYERISALPDPDPANVEKLRVWIRSLNGGNYCIADAGASAWGKLSKEEDPKGRWAYFKQLFPPWESRNLDLIAGISTQKSDPFSCWVQLRWLPFWRSVTDPAAAVSQSGGDPEKNENDQIAVKDQFTPEILPYVTALDVVQTIISVIVTLVACALPVAGIAVLAITEGLWRRIGLIAGLTILFALGLMLLTDCRKHPIQIFTATAAFTAVLVVFVQNQ